MQKMVPADQVLVRIVGSLGEYKEKLARSRRKAKGIREPVVVHRSVSDLFARKGKTMRDLVAPRYGFV